MSVLVRRTGGLSRQMWTVGGSQCCSTRNGDEYLILFQIVLPHANYTAPVDYTYSYLDNFLSKQWQTSEAYAYVRISVNTQQRTQRGRQH